jgi:beta-galactosidase
VNAKAEMLDEKGNVEKTFNAALDVKAADHQTVTASWPWPNPRLWDYKQPNRYTLRLTLSGAGVVDQYVQPFGFREFYIVGRDFYLNGTLFNLRPNIFGRPIQEVIEEGYNFAEHWPDDITRRGKDLLAEDAAATKATEAGFPIAAKVRAHGGLGAKIKEWEKPEFRAEWERLMSGIVRRWRNEPGVVMWAHTANLFATATTASRGCSA